MPAMLQRFEGPEVEFFYHSAAVEMERVFLADITVPESVSRIDTELDIQPLDRLIFHARGQIWAGVFLTGANGPEGWSYRESGRKYPLPGGHPYSLLGQISGRYFEIGTRLVRIYIGASIERLYLCTNNDAPGNGTGSFACTVEVWRPARSSRA